MIRLHAIAAIAFLAGCSAPAYTPELGVLIGGSRGDPVPGAKTVPGC